MPPLTGTDFHNPELTGPRASPNIPGGGLFSAYASATINAPPEAVYDAILDVGDYRKWNTFVTDVTVTKNANPHSRHEGSHKRMTNGTCMIFHSKFQDEHKSTVRQVVTLVEKLKLSREGHGAPCVTRIRWRLDNAAASTPSFLLKSERINEIEELPDGTTKYRTWQTFGGPVSRYLRKRLETPFRESLQDWVRDMKKWIEEGKGKDEGVEETMDSKQLVTDT